MFLHPAALRPTARYHAPRCDAPSALRSATMQPAPGCRADRCHATSCHAARCHATHCHASPCHAPLATYPCHGPVQPFATQPEVIFETAKCLKTKASNNTYPCGRLYPEMLRPSLPWLSQKHGRCVRPSVDCLGLALSRMRHAPAVASARPRHPPPLRWQTHLQPPEATKKRAWDLSAATLHDLGGLP